MISFFVPGDPKSLKRHRTVKIKGGKSINYDPSKGDKADFLAKSLRHRPETPFSEPLLVKMMFRFQRPMSHYGTGKNAGKLKPDVKYLCVKTPDLDNLIKFVGDSFNGVFWSDDKYVARVWAEKCYSDNPGVKIEIYNDLP